MALPQRIAIEIATALFLLLGGAAAAEDVDNYPTRPIRMIVPFAPGGASDFVARMIQPGVSQILGQQIVVDNRPGAAGIIGTEAAAGAAPDGYTTFLGNIGTISINPQVYVDMRVKPEQALAPVSLCADMPSILITRPDFPANTVGELIAYVKANPGKTSFASPGSSTLNRLEMELFRRDAGLDMVHVPYKGGAGPAVMDVLGGHVDLMFTTISSAMEFVKAKKVKALAVTTAARMADLPDIPTMVESGYKDFVFDTYTALMAPAKTPPEYVAFLEKHALAILAKPDTRKKLTEAGFDVTARTGKGHMARVTKEVAMFKQIIADAKIRI